MILARLDRADHPAITDFIRANTKLISPPLVPEILLHLAEESLPIWQQTEEQLGEINLPPPFWAFAWAGGQALARYLFDNPALCARKTVLDVGTGSGLAAIASAMCGATEVVAADIDPIALVAAKLNAKANGVIVKATIDDLLAAPAGIADVVLIGDLFYERALADRVIAYVESAKARGMLVLIGDPRRSYFPRERFQCVAEFEVPVTRELEDAEIKRSAVWRA